MMRRLRHAAPVLLLLTCGLLAGPLAAPAAAETVMPASQQDPDIYQANLIRHVLPSVVGVLAHAKPQPEGNSMQAAGRSDTFDYLSSAGSGFIVDPSGLILTNWHVVAGAYEVFVTLSDGTRLDAEVVNAARIIDLALLRVHAGHPLQAVTWGDSSKVQVGDSVLAIGNPLGIGISVSRGIVSALHRNISDTPYDDFIQTDAAINHGNSGGPLFNREGEVIGVNSALISPTTANAGLGFALPAYQAEFVLNQLKKYGWVRPGWLGVKIQSLTVDMAHALKLPQKGSIVAWLTPGGPAEHAGLKVGDVIVRFEEDHPDNERQLLRDISGSPPGRHVTLGVIRGGKTIDIPVTLGEWPRMAWEKLNAPLKATPPHWVVPVDLGIKVTPLTDMLRRDEHISAAAHGALVTSVAQSTDAIHRGLSPGDVIIRIGDTPIRTEADLTRAVEAARKTGDDLAMVLVFQRRQKNPAFPTPEWLPLRVSAE